MADGDTRPMVRVPVALESPVSDLECILTAIERMTQSVNSLDDKATDAVYFLATLGSERTATIVAALNEGERNG